MLRDGDTLPKVLKQNFERFGNGKVAMREKDLGIWKNYSWSEYYHRVKYLSLFLISMGLEPGDKVAILGENCPEVYWAELAAQSAQGVAVGIFSDCVPSEVNYFVNHSDCRFIFAHDQEQIDKILEIRAEIPTVKKVIYWDPKGLWSYEDPVILFIEDALKIGQDYEREHPGVFEERISAGVENDIAVIVYTSGTTGLPKAAMLSHKCLLSGSKSFETVDHFNEADNYLSFIPVAWITEQLIGIAASMRAGFVVNFPEGPETVTENIREIGPSIIFFSPRQWESINRMVQSKILDTTWLKKTIYHRLLPLGQKMADTRLARKKPGPALKFLNALGHLLLFKPLRDNLGLSGIRVAYTAGSAISPSIIRLFQSIGVNVKQIYGSSEMGLVTEHRDGDIRPETSGQPFPGAQIKMSAQGEILVKNEGMFVGYYKNRQAYEDKFSDGWYRSGDYGFIDEHDHLIVVDRMDDLKSLKGGKKFSPQYPEIHLRASPYIKEVIVVGGEEKEYATCLVNIDLDNVGRWAEESGIAYTTFADLSQKTEVIVLIKGEIEKINKALPPEARIRKFLNMPKEFDADESELTRTRKLRRGLLEERYENLIQAQYGNRNEIDVETPIVYRDGRKGVVKRTIRISTLHQ